jgi:hypothetical protein
VGASAWGRPQAKPKDITDINVDELWPILKN